MEAKKITVAREGFERSGKTFYAYFAEAKVNGKTFRADIVPAKQKVEKDGETSFVQDPNAYRYIEMLFEAGAKVVLRPVPYSFVDKTGVKREGMTFEIAEDGVDYGALKVVPKKPSDRAFLERFFETSMGTASAAAAKSGDDDSPF